MADGLVTFDSLLFPQGMLEPTKEPVKPVSAAEMIASIAQTPPAAPEKSSCPSETVQVGGLQQVVLVIKSPGGNAREKNHGVTV